MGYLDYSGLSYFLDKLKTIFVLASSKGQTNGVASLDTSAKVPKTQIPDCIDVLFYDSMNFSDWTEWVSGTSYAVGDKVKITDENDVTGYICKTANSSAEFNASEWNEATAFPVVGSANKMYVDSTTNIIYRWSGTAYVSIGSALTLGETSTTAYRGDRGAAAYAHGVTNKGSAFASGMYKITTNSEGHVTAATAVGKSDITALGIVSGPDSSTDEHVAVFDGTSGNTVKDSGYTIATSVPANAVFTDTTYESKTAAQSGTDESLVTTGEKYIWNNKIDLSLKGANSGVAELDSNGKVPTAQLPSGLVPTTLYRQFWTSTNEVQLELDDDGKTYVIWCAGSTSGTSGAIADSTYGAYIFVSNGCYYIERAGSGITVTESDSILTVSSADNIAMGIVEL